MRSHADHLPAAVYASIAETLLWLQRRDQDHPSLSPWLGVDLVSSGPPAHTACQSDLLQDLQWAISQLQSKWSFRIADHASSSSAAVTDGGELPRRRISRLPGASLPSLRGILHWPPELRFPRQHHISHFITAQLWSFLRTPASCCSPPRLCLST